MDGNSYTYYHDDLCVGCAFNSEKLLWKNFGHTVWLTTVQDSEHTIVVWVCLAGSPDISKPHPDFQCDYRHKVVAVMLAVAPVL